MTRLHKFIWLGIAVSWVVIGMRYVKSHHPKNCPIVPNQMSCGG